MLTLLWTVGVFLIVGAIYKDQVNRIGRKILVSVKKVAETLIEKIDAIDK